MPPRGKAWETSRRREYRAQLAGHPAGDTIARAATFLTRVCTAAGHAGEASTLAAP
jgi:hypothetical protein